MNGKHWTLAEDAELSRLWSDRQLTTTAIGVLLGRSQTAVSGRAMRLGLAPRISRARTGMANNRPRPKADPAPIPPAMEALARFDPVVRRAMFDRMRGLQA